MQPLSYDYCKQIHTIQRQHRKGNSSHIARKWLANCITIHVPYSYRASDLHYSIPSASYINTTSLPLFTIHSPAHACPRRASDLLYSVLLTSHINTTSSSLPHISKPLLFLYSLQMPLLILVPEELVTCITQSSPPHNSTPPLFPYSLYMSLLIPVPEEPVTCILQSSLHHISTLPLFPCSACPPSPDYTHTGAGEGLESRAPGKEKCRKGTWQGSR